ncbi:VOC family protein [Nocardioides sp. R-C-SC26]|uniref:VOC family protein n=1 Tax=Nocardioides sp. R-C-SC26 TaxID=2870414 RepID=UPI001E5C1702|nr:VOC family protein [Nocardioides sp. R-C-SC26]
MNTLGRTRFLAGEPAWIELSAADADAAEEFYVRLLGWKVRHERLGDGVYRMCSLDGRDVAGIVSAEHLHGGASRGWITYVAVDDAADAVRRALALGAEIVQPPRTLPDAGVGACVVDPFGAILGLYQGEARAGIESLNTVGALCWNELSTGEPDGSIAFYRELFGFDTRRDLSPTDQPYTVLTVGEDLPVAGVLELEQVWPNVLPARWLPYLGVADIDAAVESVLALGGALSLGPVRTQHGVLVVVHDPGGNALNLIALETGLRRSALFPTTTGA